MKESNNRRERYSEPVTGLPRLMRDLGSKKDRGETAMDVVQKIAYEIQQDGKITKADLEMLEDAILADKVVTKQEQKLIDAIIAKVRGAEQETASPIEALSQQIQADGVVTWDELDQLHSAIMADGSLSSEERMILQDIVSKLRMKKLRED